MQLIRFESAWLVYAATAGFYIDIYHTVRGLGVNPGFYASLTLGFGNGVSFGVAVNVWAAALLLMLMHARPDIRDETASAERQARVASERRLPSASFAESASSGRRFIMMWARAPVAMEQSAEGSDGATFSRNRNRQAALTKEDAESVG